MADNSDLQKIQASEKPTSDDFEYAYVETVNKAFVRIAKERLKEILGANRYTNEEIDQKLSTIPKFNIEVVSSLPTTDISETTIYLVSSGDDSENLYTEYININGLWEILGTQKSTFSGSAKDVTYDDTETKLGATNVQDAVGKLSEEVNDLKDNGTGSGVTTAMSESLWAIIQKTAFAEQLTNAELTAFKTAWGITEEEPDTPPTGNTEPVYQLAEAKALDGTIIDTGFAPFKNKTARESAFTICVDIEGEFAGNGNAYVFSLPTPTILCMKYAGWFWQFVYYQGNAKIKKADNTDMTGTTFVRTKYILTKTADSTSVSVYCGTLENIQTISAMQSSDATIDENVILGGANAENNVWIDGNVYDFKWYDRVLSDEEITSYFEGV